MKVASKISLLVVFCGLALTGRAADTSLLNTLEGSYKGNVAGTFLGLGSFAQTGHLEIKKMDGSIKISCWSLMNNELSQLIPIGDLNKYFGENAEQIQVKDGITETRVAFMRYKDNNYGFFHKWLGGLTQTVWAYQFKFRNGKLVACRIQQYNTGNKEKLLYLLELTNLTNQEPKKPSQSNTNEEEKEDETRFDWNF